MLHWKARFNHALGATMAFRNCFLCLSILFFVGHAGVVWAQSPSESFTYTLSEKDAWLTLDEDFQFAFIRSDEDSAKARLVNATTGETVREFEFPDSLGQAIKLSPDGSRLLVKRQKKQDKNAKLAVFDISRQPKELCEVDIKAFDGSKLSFPNSDLFLCFSPDARTRAGSMGPRIGTLTGYSTADGTVKFEVERLPNISRPQFTADKKQFCFQKFRRTESETKLTFYDVATGSIDRTITLESLPDFRPSDVQFSPDGTQLAGILSSSFNNWQPYWRRVGVWDPQTGKLKTNFLAPGDTSGCRWLDDDILMSQKGYLFSVGKKKTIGILDYLPKRVEYNRSTDRPARPIKLRSQFADFSQTSPVRAMIKTSYLSSLSSTICNFPGTEVMQAIRALDPEPEIVFAKGAPIQVSFNELVKPPIPGFRQQVDATLEKVMADYIRVERSANRLIVSLAESQIGTELYGLDSKGQPDRMKKGEPVRIRRVTSTFELYVNDELIHKLETSGKTADQVLVKPGENYIKKLELTHWTEAAKNLEAFGYVLLPEYQTFKNLETVKFNHLFDREWLKVRVEGMLRDAKNKAAREHFDYSKVRRGAVQMPPSKQPPKSVPWNVKPFSLPELNSRILKKPMRLFRADAFQDILELSASQLGEPQLVLIYKKYQREKVMARFSLKTRKLLSSVALPASVGSLVDLRPDGKYFLTSQGIGGMAAAKAGNRSSIQLWKSSDKKNERDSIVTTFSLPNLDPKSQQQANGLPKTSGPIREAFLTGKDKVLLVGSNGVIYRSFDDPNPLYDLKVRGTIGVSPGRKYFVALHENVLKIFNSSDGSVAANLRGIASQALQKNGLSVAKFRSDGKRLLIGAGDVTSILDAETGELLSSCKGYGSVSAWKDDWRFSRHEGVSQVSTGATVWEFGATRILSAGGEDLFYLKKDAQWVSLGRWQMTSKKLQKTFDRYIDNAALLADKKVAIKVGLEKRNWDENSVLGWDTTDDFRSRIEKKISSHLVAQGFKVEPDAETVLLIKVQMNPADGKTTGKESPRYFFGEEDSEHFFSSYERSITSQIKLGNNQNHLELAGTRVLLSESPYDESWMDQNGESSLMLQFENHFIDESLKSLSFQTPLLPIEPNQQGQKQGAKWSSSDPTNKQPVSHVLGKSTFEGKREKVELTELGK